MTGLVLLMAMACVADDLPPVVVADCGRFSVTHAQARETWQWGRSFADVFEKRRVEDTPRSEFWAAMRFDLEHRCVAWEMLGDALACRGRWDESGDPDDADACEDKLHALRVIIGVTNYYGGTMPDPVTWWLFPEVDP